jgi:bifunctional DNA-binding transcriptional regulator/antitoxin component of YhaV-PrlF toxin-antitoxin module
VIRGSVGRSAAFLKESDSNPKGSQEGLGLQPGDKVKFEVLEGKRAVLQASRPVPEEVFVRTGRNEIEQILGRSKRADEMKIRKLVRSLGVKG